MSGYNSVTRAHPYRLLGPGNQQNDTGLIYTPPSLRQVQAGGTPQSVVAALLEGLGLGSFELQNRSGSTGVLGIGVRLPNRLWIAGQWDDSETTAFSDDTADAQDTGTGDFALETTTVNDGFVVACREPFNILSIDVGTASTGTPVRALRYTNSAGDGWADAPANLFIQDGASGNVSITGTTVANEYLIAWDIFSDWGRVATGGLSGIPAGYYAVNVRAPTAPTIAAVADALAVGRLYHLVEGITDNTAVFRDFAGKDRRMPFGNGLVALFETANVGNRVSAEVRMLT